MNESATEQVPVSDEVLKEERKTYRNYLHERALEGFTEIDGIEPDKDHPDFAAQLLWKKVGGMNMLHVIVVPVDEELDVWGMDLREGDAPSEVLHHPYGVGGSRGLVPEGSYLGQSKAA